MCVHEFMYVLFILRDECMHALVFESCLCVCVLYIE